MQHSQKVHIFGENFHIKSDQPPETIDKIAGYLDFKIKEIASVGSLGSANIDKFRMVVMAAMNIAGELFEQKSRLEEYDKQTHQLEEKAKLLNANLDRALV